MHLSTATFRRIVRASAVYDLVVTAPFATPWTFDLAHTQLNAVNQAMGGAALPAFTPFHVLFACLLGSVVLIWSLLRVTDPQQRFGRYDGAARMLFGTWMMWALHATGEPLLWLFIVPELAWGVLQWMPVSTAKRLMAYPGAAATEPGNPRACASEQMGEQPE